MAAHEAGIIRIGVISDTHGRLAPGAAAALGGVVEIWHAGDIGASAIIEELGAIAPVTAVQGNVDVGQPWAQQLPQQQQRAVGGVRLFMTHVGAKPAKLIRHIPEPRPAVYIFGHSHRALIAHEAGVLFLNPGAAGRPRFGGGLSVAVLTIMRDNVEAEIIPL